VRAQRALDRSRDLVCQRGDERCELLRRAVRDRVGDKMRSKIISSTRATVRRAADNVLMQFEGAHLRERAREGGYVDWWVVIVRASVFDSSTQCQRTRAALEAELGQPVVLMKQDSRGTPTYWGRPDLVDYMANVPLEDVPWQRFTLHAA
jgi:hypothetical protein